MKRRVFENPAELIAPSEGAPQEVSTSRSAGARLTSVRFVRSSSRGAREGKAMDVSPRQNEIQKARNCSNEKRHPPRASMKIQLQLKSKSRRQGYRKEIQSKWPRPAPSLVFLSSSLLTSVELSAATRTWEGAPEAQGRHSSGSGACTAPLIIT